MRPMLGRIAALGALALLAATGIAAADTLKTVRDRGELVCGVSTGLGGFSAKDASGAWTGFDVDFCRALAAAILDDPARVSFVPLNAGERFDALKAGKVDVLSRNSTWTLDREAGSGMLFAGVAYYDGQGFLVVGRPGIVSALELDGAKVCVQSGTTSEGNLADFFRANSMRLEVVALPTLDEVRAALDDGRCDVFTADQSALFSERLKLKDPARAVILPDVISKEPLGPVVRSDDLAWFNLVKWTLFALINAEELGIKTTTLEEALASQKPAVRHFTGADSDFGTRLGLTPDWAVRAVRAVGNYGEIYDRNLGVSSPLAIPRGLNHLWSMGGILYAPPVR